MSFTRNPGRFAGLLYVLTSIIGFFAMGYVPGKVIVHGNATAAANNILAHEALFRLGIAGAVVGQASEVDGARRKRVWITVEQRVTVFIPLEEKRRLTREH